MLNASSAQPSGGVHPLVLRGQVAEAAVREFSGQALQLGHRDCARLSAWVLKRLGHKISVAAFGNYASEAGAFRAMRRRGHESLDRAVDALGLPRIAPALALPCDLVAGQPEGDDPRWVALGVVLSGGRVLGFHEGVCRVLQPRAALLTAWRAL